MNDERRKRLLVIVALVCVGGYFADAVVLTPLTETWKRRAARIVELNDLLAKNAGLQDREADLKKRWDSMRSGGLPNRQSDAEKVVFEAVSRWAQDTHLSVTALKPRWTRPTKESQTLEVQVDGTGNMEAVARFIFALETDPLPINVENLEITAQDPKADRISLAIRFTGLIFEEVAQ